MWYGDKVLFKGYKNNITLCEVGTIKQRIGELVYIVQGPKNTHKRHMNQLRKCRLNESEESPQNTFDEPIDAIFDHFDLDTPQVSPEVRRSGRKRKFTQPLDVYPKRQKYFIFLPFFQEKESSWKRGVKRPKLTCIMDSSSTILIA